jgi:hypothetical protein
MRRFDPREHARNVLGERLQSCSEAPVTGFYRDGCCNTGPDDLGVHTVCALMTAEFLESSSVVARKVPSRPRRPSTTTSTPSVNVSGVIPR